MQINKDQYSKVLERLSSLDLFYLLSELAEGNPLPKSVKIDGFINLLIRKQFIDINGILTQKGIELLAYINDDRVVLQQIKEQTLTFSDFCQELHKKLQNKLVELTEKKQKIVSGKYPFLCNLTDLKTSLNKVILKYNIQPKEYYKVEKALLNHVIKSFNAKWEYVQLIENFIINDGKSKLITELENIEEIQIEKEEYTSTQKFI